MLSRFSRAVGTGLTCAVGAAWLAGCGMLPPQPEREPTVALRPLPDSPLAKIARASTPAPELSGFRLMPLGAYALDTRVQLAQRARYSLDVQYYQIANDHTGRLLLRNLRDAAARGVRVRLIVDDLYTTGGDPLFIGLAAFPNVEVRLFNPFCCGRDSLLNKYSSSLLDFQRLNHRMHNKLFVVDGVMAVAGGRNMADEYFMRGTSENFVDMDAFIVGAVVAQLEAIFDGYWNSPNVYPVQAIIKTGLDPADLRRSFNALVDEGEQMMAAHPPPIDILGYSPVADDLEAGRVGLIWGKATAFADSPAKVMATSDEMARSMSVQMNVMDLVMQAKTDVFISSPYFVPGRKGVEAFTDLCKRNVKVAILTNSLASNDEPVVHTGYSRYRAELIRAGVDLYELSPGGIQKNKRLGFPGMSLGRLHAKTAVIDRSTIFVGSMNLDPRSASKNTELGVIVQSPQLAKEVLRIFHISKLQSSYRLRFGPDHQTIEWLTMDENGEMVLTEEPDSTFYLRLQNVLLGPFVPEQQL
jgi:cardiolipin synthase C